MKDVFFCTCGFDTTNGLNALRHAKLWHSKRGRRFEDRVSLMLYTLSGAAPVDAYLDQHRDQESKETVHV